MTRSGNPTDSIIGRRSFVSLLGAGTGALALSGSVSGAVRSDDSSDAIAALSFYSTASQVDANGGPLTDEDHVLAWASPDAYVTIASESTDEDDVAFYEDDRIPLISQDRSVVGIGSAGFLSDERGGFSEGNEQFVLNVWDDLMGPDSTVLWDESHRQYWDLEAHSVFRAYAEANGYDIRALTAFDAGDAPELEFYSTASQRAPDGGPLTDEETVLVWAPETASNVDENDDGAYLYADDESIPLVSRDGSVVGFGAPFVTDDSDHDENDAFVRALWDEVIDGDAVYWDESHDQYYDAAQFEDFIADAEADGYAVEGTDDLLAVLEDDADAVVITSPETAFTNAELEALRDFADGGGAVFLHDQSEFNGHDRTGNLNELADGLDLSFRFNADQVEDEATGWDDFVFTTTAFDDAFLETDGDDGEIGLADADGLVITTPEWEFRESEFDRLEEFVDDGGAVFLFDQSDFGGNDRTGNLNEIADALDLAFRFNGGQVEDEVQNAGPEYVPVATDFAGPDDYVADRPGVGIDFEHGAEYYGRVVRVFDGDTVEVEFDSEFGYRETVRQVGLDTAETPPAENDPEEWFGIPDDADEHLHEWGENATEFALEVLAPEGASTEEIVEGRRVRMTFDPVEPLRGNYGRLLMNVHYDPDAFDADAETGDFSVSYNRRAVEEGYARVYSSGFSTHDALSALEEAALADGRGVWSAADFDALEEIRNEPVESLFVPNARSIRSRRGRDGGRLREERVPVYAAETATQVPGDDAVEYDDLPLVGVDERKRVALVGGLLIHERYEAAEGFPEDTSAYGNFPFLANLIDRLSDADGDVLIAGGQGQFNASGSISLERCQYFLRYLEGVGTRLRQINDLPGTLPAMARTPRAVFVTAPVRELELAEIVALRRYRLRGGAVVLLGSADATTERVGHLNDLARWLNTDLRFNDDTVRDEATNLADEPSILETTAFNETFPLFDAYEVTADDTHPKRDRGRIPPRHVRGRD